MQATHRFAILSILGLMIPITSLPAQELGERSSESIGFLNGLTAGKALVEGYDGDRREDFVRGLRAALQSMAVVDEEEVLAAKQGWFNGSDIGKAGRSSWAYGYLLAGGHKEDSSPFLPFYVALGYLDGLQNDGVDYVPRDQGTAIVTQHQRTEFYKQRKLVADKIREHEGAGRAFLERNSKKPGVIVTGSGLQYRILAEGSGPSPAAADTVVLSVLGTKIDGEVFYDTELNNEGEPISIRVDRTLDGWQEALVRMSQGAEWELFLPASLAYGNSGWQTLVEPGEALIYRVRLLEVLSEP